MKCNVMDHTWVTEDEFVQFLDESKSTTVRRLSRRQIFIFHIFLTLFLAIIIIIIIIVII